MSQGKEILLVSLSSFTRAMADTWISSRSVRHVSPREFTKLELRLLAGYNHILLDTNHPRDLERYEPLLKTGTNFVVLGTYDIPMRIVLSSTPLNYKLKSHGMKGIFEEF